MRNSLIITLSLGLLVSAGCSKSPGRSQAGEPGAPTGMASKAGEPEAPTGMASKAGEPDRAAPPEGRARPTDPSVTAVPPRAPSSRLVPLWTATGLKVPESVLHDAERKAIYVSCINGKPTEKNGKGYIAKLSMTGAVLSLEWARGMDAPKGMGLVADLLWVTDIDRLHVVDVKTGKIVKTVSAPAAKFLNDIAIGGRGEVFVSDMVTGKVHVVRGAKLELLADLASHKGSNGMLMHGGHLLVGTSTGIVKVELPGGKATLLVPVRDFGMIDGLKAYGPDGFVVSNWAGKTQLVHPGGQPTVLLDTTAQKIQSADLEYIAESRTLLIPTFFDNRVVAYRIEP